MPQLVKLGIAGLKIEGRYKDAEYVALTTRAYRRAVDEAWAGQVLSLSPAEELQLEQVYSRGLGPHFIGGTDHQQVVRGRSPRHRGVLMGKVARVLADRVVVRPAPAQQLAPLEPGDGLVFDAAHWRSPQEKEEGGRMYQVAQVQGGVELRFGNGAVDFARIRPGDLVWRNHDPDTDKAALPYVHPSSPPRARPRGVCSWPRGTWRCPCWSEGEGDAAFGQQAGLFQIGRGQDITGSEDSVTDNTIPSLPPGRRNWMERSWY